MLFHWFSMKIKVFIDENHWNLMKINEIWWKSMKFDENQWNSTKIIEFHQISWIFVILRISVTSNRAQKYNLLERFQNARFREENVPASIWGHSHSMFGAVDFRKAWKSLKSMGFGKKNTHIKDFSLEQ